LVFQAPAKINLSLKIHGKRADGFHEIESLFVPISLADELTMEPAEQFSFSCDEPGVPGDERNLAVRAVQLFAERTNVEPRIRLTLSKKIPHGAGLGGGSSDAAATVLALNEFFGTALGMDALAAMAAQLGSDVPFFLYGSAAICRGRGEMVTPQLFNASLPLLLLKPPFEVPTPWAYQHWRDSRELPTISYAAQEFAWGTLVNDLERPVFEKFIVLATMKTWLFDRPEVSGALMSGSGSTLFAVLRDRGASPALAKDARAEFGESLWTCECETVG
jgi:4-diphosphocytidyl-2-C-methyl-D-erythritol kinase